jgi:hypothetical protein
VAFISGSLMIPSLQKELTRLIQSWRFTPTSSDITLSFTLLFS